MDDRPYQEMTKDELQRELAARGLPTSGNKEELVTRLEDDDVEQGEAGDLETTAGTGVSTSGTRASGVDTSVNKGASRNDTNDAEPTTYQDPLGSQEKTVLPNNDTNEEDVRAHTPANYPSSQALQAQQELERAQLSGNDEAVRAARKRLEAAQRAAGVSEEDIRSQNPTGRQAPGRQEA